MSRSFSDLAIALHNGTCEIWCPGGQARPVGPETLQGLVMETVRWLAEGRCYELGQLPQPTTSAWAERDSLIREASYRLPQPACAGHFQVSQGGTFLSEVILFAQVRGDEIEFRWFTFPDDDPGWYFIPVVGRARPQELPSFTRCTDGRLRHAVLPGWHLLTSSLEPLLGALSMQARFLPAVLGALDQAAAVDEPLAEMGLSP